MRISMLVCAAIASAACYRAPAASDTTQTKTPDVVSSRTGAGATVSTDTQRSSTAPVAPGDTGVTLRLDRSSYKSGDPMALRLVNATNDRLAYNPCTRVLERETNGRWTALIEDRMCTMIAHILEPRSSRAERTELSRGLNPGRYRIVIPLSVEGPTPARTVRATSEPFSVSP